MSDTIEQHQEQPSVGERSPELAEGCCPIAVAAPERVRGRACGQAENPAMEIGIDAQVEGGRYPVPGLAANSAGRDMSPTQKLEALV